MPTSILKRIIGLLAVLSLCATVAAVPLDWETNPEYANWGTIAEQGSKDSELQTALSESSPTIASGDTIYVLCDIASYQFGYTNDCWGYTAPDGREYALVGTGGSIAIINITDDQLVTTVPHTGCTWQDIKTYQNFAYAVSECGGANQGIVVINLSGLPTSVSVVGNFPVNNLGHVTSHNLSIDTVKGFLYCEGSSGSGSSIYIHSLANPAIPAYMGRFGPPGIHDMVANNDTVYVAAGWNPYFEIYDLANKASPVLLAQVSVPNSGYVHNIWPSADGNYVVTTEETGFKTIKVWDISNLSNVQLLTQFLGPSNLAHNAQIQGDRLFASHYEAGIISVDFSNPATASIIGQFDTFGGNSPDFNGCWGVFPHTPSGNIYSSNMEGIFYVLHEIEGVLNDTLSGQEASAAPGTQVRIDVSAVNTLPIQQFLVPFDYNGPMNVTFDSVSTVGARTDYFEVQQFVAFNPGGKQMAYKLVSSNSGTSPDLPVGSGLILSLYFTIPSNATADSNFVTFSQVQSTAVSFGHKCVNYVPDTVSGLILLDVTSCCLGMRGNVDGDGADDVNIVDLTYISDFMFNSGPPPPCAEEADVNGDGSPDPDILDLTYMVDYLFGVGPPPVACP